MATATKKSDAAKKAKAEKAARLKKSTTKAKKRKVKRIITSGSVHILAGFNNTLITVTDQNDETIAWSSAGSSGFKGSRKSTPYAAQTAARNAAEKAKEMGLERVEVFVKGIGSGREQAVRGLGAAGLVIEGITDVTPIPHGGCRRKGARRV